MAEKVRQTRCYTEEETKDILTHFSLLTDYIVKRNLISTAENSVISRLITYLNDHPELNISIAEAAKLFNCSTSYLTHNFRKATGKSFKEYALEQKFMKADELLNSDKSLKIYEIAGAVGYSNPFTFSHIYKKYRGYPPSKSK